MEEQNTPKQTRMLTETMDIGTREFCQFQSILFDKTKRIDPFQKKIIELRSIQYEMEDDITSDDTDVKAVGTYLKAILKALDIPQNRFANYIGLRPSNFSKLLKGERPVNYDLALIFGKLFNHDPMLWIKIQAKNKLKKLDLAQGTKYRDYSLTDLLS